MRWLLSRGLLDELVLTVFPIVVGSGLRLFQNMPAEQVGLRRTDSRALASGALSLRTRRRRASGPDPAASSGSVLSADDSVMW